MEESYTGAVNNTQRLLLILIGISICVNLISVIGFALRDWDEGVFALQGQWIASGFSRGKPYNFQTPPLYPVIAGIGILLAGGNPVILALFSFLFSILTLIVIYNMAKSLYDSNTAIFSIALFASSEYFFFFSKSGLSEALFLLLFSAVLWSIIRNRTGQIKYFILTGLFITLAMYTKYSGLVLLAYALFFGMLMQMYKKWQWYIFQIAVPLILFLPFLFLFIEYGSSTNTGQRFIELIGLNYHKHLYYLIAFAPAVFFLAGIAQFQHSNKHRDSRILLFSFLIYFIPLGLYYAYFRLVYPMIMLLAVIGATLNIQPRLKSWIILIAVVVNIAFSVPTIIYQNRLPNHYAQEVKKYVNRANIEFLYSALPPNIEFYLPGKFAIPDNHPWHRISLKCPIFGRNRKILHESENELNPGDRILIAHASINDSLKSAFPEVYSHAQLILSYRFIDAPLYGKDIFNPALEQRFELYLLPIENKSLADKMWQFGFKKGISVLVY